jgi:hypothetical protein
VALNAGYAAIIGIAVCWLGLFLPGILMIYAVLPWWGAFRNLAVYRRRVTRCSAAETRTPPSMPRLGALLCNIHAPLLHALLPGLLTGLPQAHCLRHTSRDAYRSFGAQNAAGAECCGGGPHHGGGVPAVVLGAGQQPDSRRFHLHRCASYRFAFRSLIPSRPQQTSRHVVLSPSTALAGVYSCSWCAEYTKASRPVRSRSRPTKTEPASCHTPDCALHWTAGIIGFCMVDFLAVPAPAAIGAGGLLGAVAWAAKMN